MNAYKANWKNSDHWEYTSDGWGDRISYNPVEYQILYGTSKADVKRQLLAAYPRAYAIAIKKLNP